MRGMGEAIARGTFESFREQTRANWSHGDIPPR
jgi:queuine tRNA-ribosyltransferase